MHFLLDNTIVVAPPSSDDPQADRDIMLRRGDALPDWAEGLVGDHLLSDEPPEPLPPSRALPSREIPPRRSNAELLADTLKG